jgi:NitT/TauT family transport system substrate-binding protein
MPNPSAARPPSRPSVSARRSARLGAVLVAGLGLLLSACGRPSAGDAVAAAAGGQRVRFQTDWHAQPEHGGHYQALALGYYAAVGLDVDVMVGGPGAFATQKVATGQVEFAMGRSDDVMLAVQQGLPLLIVCALMQQDPQALMLHAHDPVQTFADLNGRTVMAPPGAAWIKYLQQRHGIRLNFVPLNYGVAQFLSQPDFIQQCFITSEPYQVSRQGAAPRTLLIAHSGYDPYRVIIANPRFARENPAAVRAFVAASLRGWHDYLHGDPGPAEAMIAARNPAMDPDRLAYGRNTLRRLQLVEGDPARGDALGLLRRARLQRLADTLHELELLSTPLRLERFVTFEFLPDELRARVDD